MEKSDVRETPGNTTCIMKCTCEHEYQDGLYGNRMRLHNRTGKTGSTRGWRCTVCGNLRK